MNPLRVSDSTRNTGLALVASLCGYLITSVVGCADEQATSSDGGPVGGTFDRAVPPLEAGELVRYSCSSIGQYWVAGIAVVPDDYGNPWTSFRMELGEAWLNGSAPVATWTHACGVLDGRSSSARCPFRESEEYVVFWMEIDDAPGDSVAPSGDVLAMFREVDGVVMEAYGHSTEYSTLAEFRDAVDQALSEAGIASVDGCTRVPYAE